MKYYRAVFEYSDDGITVFFPDLKGCITEGDTRTEAYENAIDALPLWLAHAQKQFIKPPSSYEKLKEKYPGDEIVEIPVDEIALEKFSPTQRVNAVFTKQLLNEIDEYRQSKGLNRSKLLSEAVNEYMGNHP